MDLEKLPKKIWVNDRIGFLHLYWDTLGWMATYMYYEMELLEDLEYRETAKEAVEQLGKWLENNKILWTELGET